MYNVQCTMYNVQCTMYNVQCIINKEFAAQYIGQADKDRLQSLIDNLRQRPGESVLLFLPKLQRLMQSLNEKVTEEEII